MRAGGGTRAHVASISSLLGLTGIAIAGFAMGLVALAGTWFITSSDHVDAVAWIVLFNVFALTVIIGSWVSRLRWMRAFGVGVTLCWVLTVYLFATDFFYGSLS